MVVYSLYATLDVGIALEFDFNVYHEKLLQPGETTNDVMNFVGPGPDASRSYLLHIHVGYINDAGKDITTDYTRQITINPPASETATYEISEEQAIAIASQYFPVEVILQSKITVNRLTSRDYDIWQVSFDGFNTTREELILSGWDADTLPTIIPQFHVATINVDADSGVVLLKVAGDIRLGPRPAVNYFGRPFPWYFWPVIAIVSLVLVAVIIYLFARLLSISRAKNQAR